MEKASLENTTSDSLKKGFSETQSNKEEHSDISTRMKFYENSSLSLIKIPPHMPFIVRLDGKNFSKFTAGMRKPFDLLFTKAMLLTTSDLLTEFTAATGYSHSDEISLIFRPACTKEDLDSISDKKFTHIFDGRVIKLLTTLSGFCSARFNYHLIQIVNLETNQKFYEANYLQKLKEMRACFDARLIVFPEDQPGEIVNHMIWRSLFDCERNAVSTWARFFYSGKALEGKSKREMIEKLKTNGIDWQNGVPFILKHGVYLKKESFEIEAPFGGGKVLRTRVAFKAFKIKYGDLFLNEMLGKLWSDDTSLMQDNGIVCVDIEKDF